jgi:hypothetical protein
LNSAHVTSEGGAQEVQKDLRLLPSREVPAFKKPVVMNELGVGSFRPTQRGRIDLVRKGAPGDRYRAHKRLRAGHHS